MALSEWFSSLAMQSHPCVEWTGGWACLKDASIKTEGGLSCEMTYCFSYQRTLHSSKPAELRTYGVEARLLGAGSEFSSKLHAEFGAVSLLLLVGGSPEAAQQCEP